MFVKIIRGQHEGTYECSRYHLTPQDEEATKILLTMEHKMDGSDGRSVLIDKTVPERLEVYVMNSLGQTVDRIFIKAEDE